VEKIVHGTKYFIDFYKMAGNYDEYHIAVMLHCRNPTMSIHYRGEMTMETSKITKQVIDFQKTSFENWYSAISVLQDQAVSAMDMMLDQAYMIPEEGRSAIQGWMGLVQEERDRFKTYVDKGFTTLEKAAAESCKPVEKAKKAAS
jgi:hypothetical protein